MHASPWVLLKRLHTKCFPLWIRRRSYLYFLTCVYSSPPPKKVAATKIDWPVPLVCHMLILNIYCNSHSYPSLAQGPEPLYTFLTSEKSVCVYLIYFQVPDPSFTNSIFLWQRHDLHPQEFTSRNNRCFGRRREHSRKLERQGGKQHCGAPQFSRLVPAFPPVDFKLK